MTDGTSVETPLPLVSVVIPVFNGEQFVRSAIETVMHQSYGAIEVIAVDDGSTDHTLDALQRAASDFGRFPVRIVSGVNRGVAAARNLGIAHAQGTFVSFLDVDDVWAATKIQRQVEALVADSAYVGVGCQYWTWKTNPISSIRGYESDWSKGAILRWLLLEGRGVLLPSTLTCRRDVLVSIGGFDTDLGTAADLDLAWRLVNFGEVLCLQEQLTGYRLSPSQMHRDLQALRDDYTVLSRKQPLSESTSLQHRVHVNFLLLTAYRHFLDKPSSVRLASLLWVFFKHPLSLVRMAVNR